MILLLSRLFYAGWFCPFCRGLCVLSREQVQVVARVQELYFSLHLLPVFIRMGRIKKDNNWKCLGLHFFGGVWTKKLFILSYEIRLRNWIFLKKTQTQENSKLKEKLKHKQKDIKNSSHKTKLSAILLKLLNFSGKNQNFVSIITIHIKISKIFCSKSGIW